MAEKSEKRISITKLNAARRQLETAVQLWFLEADPVSIHTLIAAAHRIVDDVASHKGIKGAPLLDGKLFEQLGYDAKACKKAVRAAENFFKHALKDPDQVFDFSTEVG